MGVPDNPLVSVVIPAYNAEPYLAAALASCLQQTHRNLEAIVVDDGSSDRTAAIAREWADKDERVRLFPSVNQGPAVARNIGLGLARGDYIKFLDSDDLLPVQAIASQLQALRIHNTAMAIGQALLFWPERDRPAPSLTDAWADASPSERLSLMELRVSDAVPAWTYNEVLLEKSLVRAAGGFDPLLRLGEELLLDVRLLLSQPALQVAYQRQCPVVFKRIRLDSLAVQNRNSPRAIADRLWLHRRAAETILQHNRPHTTDECRAIATYIFDYTYRNAIFAWRAGFSQEAATALEIWHRGGFPPPALTPWHHDRLHRWLGLAGAERCLAIPRRLRNLLRQRSVV